jgi:soluble lytic murein transglycosylase-like protein
MRLRVFLSLLILSPLAPCLVESSDIRVRVDTKGKKIFYNIPVPSPYSRSSNAVSYSRRVEEYWPIITDACSRHGVDAELVKAVIQVESNYNHRAVSPKGAMGLMQLMPGTANRYGVKKAFDPQENVEGGVHYLKDLLALFGSDMKLALAAYNAGEGAVQRNNGIPNYVETQNYVRKVLALYNGEASYVPYAGGGQKNRLVTYFKYIDAKGVTHYTSSPKSGVQATKVSFYY